MTSDFKNNKFVLILACCILMSVMACQNPINSNTSKSDNTQLNEQDLTLNQGQKWQINKEMLPFIQAQENRLNAYINSKDSNYIALANSLNITNQKLIKSCTMTGESHEQLHHWLHPHIQLIDQLQKTEYLQASDSIIKQIQSSFNLYHQYFQ